MLYVVDRCLDYRTINIIQMNNLFVCQPLLQFLYNSFLNPKLSCFDYI